MISELFNSLEGGVESVEGLEKLVRRIEEHHSYFWLDVVHIKLISLIFIKY